MHQVGWTPGNVNTQGYESEESETVTTNVSVVLMSRKEEMESTIYK